MRYCPACREEFEDDLSFCMFDGTPLYHASAGDAQPRAISTRSGQAVAPARDHKAEVDSYATARQNNAWKIAFFVLLALALFGIGGLQLYYLKKQSRIPSAPAHAEPVALEAAVANTAATVEQPEKPLLISQIPREELLKILPQNLMRRFHAGEAGRGLPDDLRVISTDDGEYVVLLGSGRLDDAARTPAQRMLILKREDLQFRDVTGQLLPGAYAAGTVRGPSAQVRFDSGSLSLIIRQPASSNSIIEECASCERAHQQVTLDWNGARYVESAREWENDRYTALYVLAEALEKRRVEARARPFIDSSLDAVIAEGFARSQKRGWTIEWTSGDEKDAAVDYKLSNGDDQLVITISKIKDHWKAARITAETGSRSDER